MLYYKSINIKGIAKLYYKYIYKYSYLLKVQFLIKVSNLFLYFRRSFIKLLVLKLSFLLFIIRKLIAK